MIKDLMNSDLDIKGTECGQCLLSVVYDIVATAVWITYAEKFQEFVH